MNPEQIPLAEMVGEDDYELALTLIRQWDMEKYEKAVKELWTEYEDVAEYDDDRILTKFTVREFQRMYKRRGKIPFNESSFLELLPSNIKYVREKEALIGIPKDFREWMRKAGRLYRICLKGGS